jgi:hypothetical protein
MEGCEAGRYSPTETLVEFDFGCKFMFVTGKIDFYAAAIILLINAKRVVGLRFAMLASGRDVTGSGSVIYDKLIFGCC